MSQSWGAMRQHEPGHGLVGLPATAQGLFAQVINNLKPYLDEKSDPSEDLESGDLALEIADRYQRSLSCSLGCR